MELDEEDLELIGLQVQKNRFKRLKKDESSLQELSSEQKIARSIFDGDDDFEDEVPHERDDRVDSDLSDEEEEGEFAGFIVGGGNQSYQTEEFQSSNSYSLPSHDFGDVADIFGDYYPDTDLQDDGEQSPRSSVVTMEETFEPSILEMNF